MAELTIGIDLGPTSIGWALIDEAAGALVNLGVRVFPEGVDRDTSGAEQSKSAQRRGARLARRQIERRTKRKLGVRRALVTAGLLPDSAGLGPEDEARRRWEQEQFSREDPYSLRRRALDQNLDLHEVGRVLLHLCQRRGFQSNRKADRARKKETSEMLTEISDLAAAIEGTGCRTLGEYLANLRGADPALFHQVRLRGRHTRRDMYSREFDAIWEVQSSHHPDVLTPELRDRLHHLIFFQRPLRPPSPALVGRCEVEPRLPRAPRADRRFQRFRLLNEANNLRIQDQSAREERALSVEEREKLIAYLSKAKDRSFQQIAKHLFEQHESIRFNLERGDRKKLDGMPIDAALANKKLLGSKWHAIPELLKDRIVAAIVDDEAGRLEFLLREAGFDPALAEKLLEETPLPEGYGSYSLHAIIKLLPHLELGMPLTSRDASQPSALREAGYAAPWEKAVATQPLLDEPVPVTNPLVRAALHEVRKVVNAILRELVYKHGHTLSRIHVELAREVRGTAAQRQKRSRDMRDRQRQRDAAAERIREHGMKPTREAIDRYLLWREQGEVCMYSGRPIAITQLLGGEVDVDHILPRSRSLDNSLMNRVVCFRDTNRDKGDRTPNEWLAQQRPDDYEQVLQRARRLPYPKYQRFLQESVELDDFFARQFVDTAYISSQVRAYVARLGADVVCVKGAHTAELRWHWGLNEVLRNDGLDLKNREDHRHHAVDAVVIALTSRSRLQQLARLWRAGGVDRTGEILSEPWGGFRSVVETAVNQVIVSHRPRRKVAGALHKDTSYGPTPVDGEYVVRKPVESLTSTMVQRIRDRVVRELVISRLEEHGVDVRRGGGKVPSAAWAEPLTLNSGVPIRRVRIVVPSDAIIPIRGGRAYVEPGSTHHLCFFKLNTDEKNSRFDVVFVSMLEAARRVRLREPVIQRVHPTTPEAEFIMSLSGNEMVLLEHGGTTDYYRFETAASTSKQMWFRHHTFAGRSGDKRAQVSKSPGTFAGRKVVVDPIGRIRWAND